MNSQIRTLHSYLHESKNTVAVTGSGISYLYGMGRLKRQTNRMDLKRKLSPQYVKKHPEEFYQMMKNAFLDATFEMGPSPVHKQLAELEKRGLLQGIITQNLDCLHQLAGSKNVVEIVGSFADNICVECGERFQDVNVWNTGKAPRCPKCGGALMPANFDRNAAGNGNMARAIEMIASADLVLIIGTSGFRSEEYLSKLRASTKPVQINPGSTVFDTMVDLNLRLDAEKVFDEILREG